MSLVWNLIDAFLFIEIIIVLLLVLPVANATKWNRLFKSQFLAMLAKQAQLYFYIVIGLLVLFLLEAIREMRKYSNQGHSEEQHLGVEMQHSMRLFRAQRNFYISGFAAFLVLVIKRLICLISEQAFLLAQSEASLKQAKSATAAARSMMGEKSVEKAKETGEDKPNSNSEAHYSRFRRNLFLFDKHFHGRTVKQKQVANENENNKPSENAVLKAR